MVLDIARTTGSFVQLAGKLGCGSVRAMTSLLNGSFYFTSHAIQAPSWQHGQVDSPSQSPLVHKLVGKQNKRSLHMEGYFLELTEEQTCGGGAAVTYTILAFDQTRFQSHSSHLFPERFEHDRSAVIADGERRKAEGRTYRVRLLLHRPC